MNKLGDTTSGQPPSCFERHDPQAVQQQPRRAAGFSTIVATTATAFSPVAFKGRASGGFPELQVESDLLPRSSFPSKRIAREGPRLLFKPLKRRVRPAPTGKGKIIIVLLSSATILKLSKPVISRKGQSVLRQSSSNCYQYQGAGFVIRLA